MKEQRDFSHFMQIFFLGELVGLPTLNSILDKFDIKSTQSQVVFKYLCKSLTYNKINQIFVYVFEHIVGEKLKSMSEKDGSCWSKELVTIVLDDSVFKQWLSQVVAERGIDEYYGKFFSGQVRRCVYGYKVVSLGICIDGVMYPLYFDFVRKKQEGVKVEKATEVAQKLVRRLGKLMGTFKKDGFEIPELHFSCDSGYNDLELSKVCQKNGLVYISVPSKSHYIEQNDVKIKISTWIQEQFETLEKAYQEVEKDLPIEQKTAFTYRFRATYVAQKREVTFLAFRLNGSKKISVIYTPAKSIFAKTLRRHWFQRTYIEQFFKTLKHVLKIQESKTTNKSDFEIKLLRFAFLAIHVQKLVRFIRNEIDGFIRKGFISIQRKLCSDNEIIDLLQSKINTI